MIVSEKGPKGKDASTTHEHPAAQSQPIHGTLMGRCSTKTRLLRDKTSSRPSKGAGSPGSTLHSLQPRMARPDPPGAPNMPREPFWTNGRGHGPEGRRVGPGAGGGPRALCALRELLDTPGSAGEAPAAKGAQGTGAWTSEPSPRVSLFCWRPGGATAPDSRPRAESPPGQVPDSPWRGCC